MFSFLGPCQLSLALENVYIWVALNIVSYVMKHPQNWSSSHRDSFLSPSPSLQPLSLHLCYCVVIHVIVVNTVSVCSWPILVCIAVRVPSCCRLWQDFHLKSGIVTGLCFFVHSSRDRYLTTSFCFSESWVCRYISQFGFDVLDAYSQSGIADFLANCWAFPSPCCNPCRSHRALVFHTLAHTCYCGSEDQC